MTYDSLDTIPYKLFFKIQETKEYKLLGLGDKSESVWMKLYDEHLNRNQTPSSKKIFSIVKEIEILNSIHKVVLLCIEILKFEFNEQIHQILTANRYVIRTENTKEYHNDLKQIEKETSSYLVKIENFKRMLPKKNIEEDYNIDDVMASFSAILGFDFDYNTISYNKFYALRKQVETKINNLKNNQNGK